MSRYIDADVLRDKLYEADAVTMRGVAIINNMPTVDAVQVVRCKDCKHYKDGFCYNPNTYDDEKTCGNTAKDWFCADGERRTDEQQSKG